MFFIVRWVLAIGNVLVATRDAGTDAPQTPLSTRQRTRRRTSSLKGTPTCSRHTLHVTITSAPHVQDVLAAATCIRPASPAPVFVLKHTTIDHDAYLSKSDPELPTAHLNAPQDVPQRKERVHSSAEAGPSSVRSCEALDNRQEEQVWCDVYDANVKILQKPTNGPECTAIIMDFETTQLLDALYSEPGAVLWEPDVPGAPYIALTPADESWDEFTDRCSNQPIPQWIGPYLHVPLAMPAFSPYGPTQSPLADTEMPIPVFSPSRFADSVRVALEQVPYQALFAQRHAYKAVAYVAALVGESIRAFYEDPAALGRLDALDQCAWTDPGAPVLEMWRRCLMVTIFESENPFAVPHIVVTGTLPNAPWDVEAATLPEQDTKNLLYVPVWSFIADLLEEQEEEAAEEEAETEAEEWWRDDSEEEAIVMEARYYVAVPVLLSESEDESDEARTPSPPSWPMHAFPSSTVRNSTPLEDVFEEDEDAGEIPSVTEARVRKPWLDDDCKEEPEPRSVNPSATFSPRFNFNATLSPIGEVSFEAAYRPLAAGYQSLWTSGARASTARDTANDARSELGADSDAYSMLSVYTDALEEQPNSETDADQSEDECRRYRRAQALPRPACNIFVNADDSDASSIASPPPARPRALSFVLAVAPEPRARHRGARRISPRARSTGLISRTTILGNSRAGRFPAPAPATTRRV
ncbi:hypothetical protein K438DRAFT_1760575 [Mycena galopus ATCC 62051]|nr:hypothetical protein K438DRAFT_1760575 [Mycena galopus ATCC 62051]